MKGLMRFHAMDMVMIVPLIPGAGPQLPIIEVHEVISSVPGDSREELLSMTVADIDTSSEYDQKIAYNVRNYEFVRG